jgi:hypothetical protein
VSQPGWTKDLERRPFGSAERSGGIHGWSRLCLWDAGTLAWCLQEDVFSQEPESAAKVPFETNSPTCMYECKCTQNKRGLLYLYI